MNLHALAEFRAVLDTAPASISVWNRELRAIELNQVCIEWNPPHVPAPWIGQHLFTLYPHVARNKLLDHERALAGERFAVFRDRRALGLATGPEFVSVSYGPVVADDDITGLIVVSVDVSPMVQHEAALRAANARLEDAVLARDEFLDLASHELRTPLTVIRASAELLARAVQREDTSHIDSIQAALLESAERMSRTVDNMHVLTGVEADADEHSEPVVIGRLVEQVLSRYERWSVGRALEVRGAAPTPVLVRPDLLAQVLDNLVFNAWRYSSGAITVEIVQTGEEITIHVLDEGPGLQPELIAQLFEPFARGTVGGLGLGLNVCRRLVEAQHGVLWAANRGTGGADVAFTLPARRLSTDSDV